MNRSKGFTLIELMIVVAIIGIIAAIAYPSYMDSVTGSRRVGAQGDLMSFAQSMERIYTEKGSYAWANGDATAITVSTSPTIFSDQSPLDGSTKFYNLRVMSAGSTAYVLRAIPINAQVGNGYIEITSTGLKRWDKNNDGSIGTGESCWAKNC